MNHTPTSHAEPPLPLIARLFVDAGNALTANGRGFKCGHEPVHQSRSQQCVKLDADKECWYCHSCQQGGDLVKAAQSLRGLSYAEATSHLKDNYGFIASASSQAAQAITTRLSDITPEKVRWLWPGRIPLAKVTVLDGDPGLGKSLLALDIAARVSTAHPMPNGAKGDLADPAGVVLLSAEDDPADTIRPRLEAAGADLSLIAILGAVSTAAEKRLPTLADLEALRQATAQVNAKLLVIDPLMAYLPAKVDSHRDQDVRHSLAPVAAFAAETGVAVLVVRHLNKMNGGNPLYRGGGSIGIIGAARSGLLAAKDPEDEERRILAATKCNLAKLPPALAYHIAATADAAPVVVWEGPSEHTATSLLAQQADGEDRSALEEAKAFLAEVLATGPKPATAVKREAAQAGIAEHTLRRARTALGIKSKKAGRPGDKEQQWTWFLPPKMPKPSEDAHKKSAGTFGDDGHLREAKSDSMVI